jgi:putative transposase
MMTATEFDLWALKAGISEPGKAYIKRVRNSPPSRKPGNRHGSNVIGAYPSRKMGLAINFESHKCELPAIHLHERDPWVLEYWDQPKSIKLSYPGKSKPTDSFLYTPDFLVLRPDGAVLQEWKNEKDLVGLAAKSPHRYLKREDGGWSCPPAEAAAAEIGLSFEVHSTAEINWSLQRNITFLEDYYRKEYPVSAEVAQKIATIVAANPGILFNELKSLAKESGVGTDDLHALIVIEAIYVDLSAAPLSEPERVHVFATGAVAAAYAALQTEPAQDSPGCGTSKITLKPGSSLIWNGVPLQVKVVGETKIAFTDKDANLVDLTMDVIRKLVRDGDIVAAPDLDGEHVVARENALATLSKAKLEYLAEANRRWEAIKPYLDGELPFDAVLPPGCKLSTLYRWRKDYREAKARCGYGYVGLIPKPQSGNGNQRIDDEVQQAVEEKITAHFKERKKLKTSMIYRAIKDFCLSKNLPCPSRKTITIKLQSASTYERTMAESGKRKAYQVKEFYYEIIYTTPRHGERPFEIGHIDHTQADVEIKCSHTGQPLGRPYITFLIDAFCRRILAVYVSFEQPSYRSCMAVLRICVKRHNRLPRIIVVDNGKEFRSTYFEALLAMFECVRKVRPPAQPRVGTVIENLFNIANVQFIHGLMGNTQAMKDVRTATKSHNPKELAVWTLEPFYERLCQYAYEVYDTCPHGTLSQSPREACLTGVENSGERAQQFIAYDEAFKMMTLPTTPRKTARIIPRYGVKIHGIYYWHDDFKRASLYRKMVQVRYEPFDVSTAYAFVDGFWLPCLSQHPAIFRGMSEKMLMLLMLRMRQQARQHGRNVENVTAFKLAEFYRTLAKDEEIMTQRKRDMESEAALRLVDGGKSVQPSPSKTTIMEPKSNAAPAALAKTDQSRKGFTAEIDETQYEDLA